MEVQSKFISGHTHLLSLIGDPVAHSVSPITHSVTCELSGINAVYLAFRIQPEEIPDVLNAMRDMEGWDGGNVTMPLKQAVIPYLDDLTVTAGLIGAVNTIEKTPDRKLIGHNTDGRGFIINLQKHGVEVEGTTVTLLGPGGAGSAISATAALDGVSKLHIFARDNGPSYRNTRDNQLNKFKSLTKCDVRLHAYEDKELMKRYVAESDILINATPVGMGEGCTDTPIPAEFLKPGMVVADAIYFPLQTQLLKDAEAIGCKTVTGIGMMQEQAALGDKIWYGIDVDVDAVAAAIES